MLLTLSSPNDFGIKTGNDDSHFNVSFAGSEGQSYKTVSTNQNY